MKRNTKDRAFTRYASALVLFSMALCATIHSIGGFHGLELRTLDLRFHLSDWAGMGRAQSSGKTVLIEIDDESSKTIRDPSLIWDPYFTKIVTAVHASVPKVIAIDVLWLRSLEDFVELKGGSIRKPLVQAFLRVASENRLALALSPKADEVSLGKHAPLLGADSFADVGLIIDDDKVVRRQAIAREASVPTFSARAALGAGAGAAKSAEPFLINYSTGPLPFERLPFADVLAKADAGDRAFFDKHFKDKIVLIGTTSSLLDRHPTPLGSETPGIYIHAFAIETLLGDKIPHLWSSHTGALAILLLCLISGWMAWALSPVQAVAGGIALGFLYVLAGIFLFARLEVITMAGPVLSLLFTLSTVLGFRFIVVDRERRQLATTFRQYMSSKIVDLLMESPEAAGLAGSKREVCVLFSDIRGFTKLSEALLPEQVVSFLNTYLSAMSQIILEHDGTVDKFIGDGIMAYFGAPVADPLAAQNSVKAALAMQKKLAELNDAWKREGKAELKIGIGIHFGEAVIGNIGSRFKMDYTAIGDAVNLASRVEGMTKDLKKDILVTDTVHARIQKQFQLEDVGEVPIRGRSAIRLFAVHGGNS